MSFHFQRLKIPDVILVQPDIFGDQRGYFMETYKWSEFSEAGIPEHFVQDNHSKSAKGVLRGLHFQKNPKAQGKLVRSLKGKIFDVVVDLRKGSPTYSQWEGVEISEENSLMVYVPPGFAHGFVVMSDHAEICYKCTAEYSRDHDRGILWNDPDIGIQWPIGNPMLSTKDENLPLLGDADNDFIY